MIQQIKLSEDCAMNQKPDETWISISGKYLVNVFEKSKRFTVTFSTPDRLPVPNTTDFTDLGSAMSFVEDLEKRESTVE